MKTIPIIGLLAALALVAGCRESQHSGHGHQHTPPHGGAPVILGKEDYHLEFVLDSTNGTVRAYILDSHMDKFIRVTNESFTVTAKLVGKPETLVFRAVANNATGEKVGDTALFEAQAGWLRGATAFAAEVDELTVRGKKYTKIPFSFPKGNTP
jgi:hypothetical protein